MTKLNAPNSHNCGEKATVAFGTEHGSILDAMQIREMVIQPLTVGDPVHIHGFAENGNRRTVSLGASAEQPENQAQFRTH
jgi:hypothetical protein